MAMTDLIPRRRRPDLTASHAEDSHPILALHREMNRLFDDAFRSFDVSPFNDSFSAHSVSWPKIEVNETEKDIKVTAELPGIDDKDVQIELANGVLAIRGEKKTETEDNERRFSERYYGRFERRIPVDDVDQEKVSAAFKDGVLTITMPKLPEAESKVKRIPINSK